MSRQRLSARLKGAFKGMGSLYLRIWLTVLLALGLFTLASGWLVQRHLANERERMQEQVRQRVDAWADLVQRSLPEADAPADEQALALAAWSMRLRLPLLLEDASGRRIGASASWERREAMLGTVRRAVAIPLDDGRTLWVARGAEDRGFHGSGPRAGAGPMNGQASMPHASASPEALAMMRPLSPGTPGLPRGLSAWPVLPGGLGLAALVLLLFLAVAAGAWPVVRRLTRRLEALQKGVETFGAGALGHRVDDSGRDEVAAVAASFNQAAARIETLVRSHQTLLANASHELRSPLARLKMAVSMLEDAPPAQRLRLRAEIDENVRELDALVEEVLLASRLDAGQGEPVREPVDLLAVAAEEAARAGADVTGLSPVDGGAPGDPPALPPIPGDERLLRRALRNLLENARRYGGGREVIVQIGLLAGGGAQLRVCDRGPGVPAAWRERIFEPFLRLPGHAEREGGVGLGLSLVRQIAQRHGGQARCEARSGGGSCFVLELPAGGPAQT
ncbi:MAG: HAMP domain-containing sensor histidine kinase [Rubrivivax sp.]